MERGLHIEMELRVTCESFRRSYINKFASFENNFRCKVRFEWNVLLLGQLRLSSCSWAENKQTVGPQIAQLRQIFLNAKLSPGLKIWFPLLLSTPLLPLPAERSATEIDLRVWKDWCFTGRRASKHAQQLLIAAYSGPWHFDPQRSLHSARCTFQSKETYFLRRQHVRMC